MLEEIRRVAVAFGLPDFQYYVIPAAAPASELEVADPLLPAAALTAAVNKETETEVVVMTQPETQTQPEPQRVGLFIVSSIAPFVPQVALTRSTRSFLLLDDVATAVERIRPVNNRSIAPAKADYEAPGSMPQRALSGGRAAVVGRR